MLPELSALIEQPYSEALILANILLHKIPPDESTQVMTGATIVPLRLSVRIAAPLFKRGTISFEAGKPFGKINCFLNCTCTHLSYRSILRLSAEKIIHPLSGIAIVRMSLPKPWLLFVRTNCL